MLMQQLDIQKQAEKIAQMLGSRVVLDELLAPSRTQSSRHLNPLLEHSLASLIDHTLLKAEATPAEVNQLCIEARTHGFGTVCLNTCYLEVATKLLEGSNTRPIAVVGFPLGAMHHEGKAFETRLAIELGAQEIDMVIRVGALIEGAFGAVLDDIQSVVHASQNRPVKVILETCLLSPEQIIQGSLLTRLGGAQFVKTSTGFSKGGATVDAVKLMRMTVGTDFGVKASGGIRTHEDAITMITAGANRLGTSNSVAIVSDQGASPSPTGGY
jgi:deoxyribose-phosphate aldolase